MKKQAHDAVRYAIEHDTLIRPDTCSICPETKHVEAHHPDYTKRLEVIWLCQNHHRQVKKGTIAF